MRSNNKTFKKVATLSLLALVTQAAPAALFSLRLDNTGTNVGGSTDDGVTGYQHWKSPNNWTLTSGVDDGANGIPDGTDTVSMNRNSSSNGTRLFVNDLVGPTSVAGITAEQSTGTNDIVFKRVDFTIGDLTVLSTGSGNLHIREERNRSLTFNGILAGSGNLILSRSGGFIGSADVLPTDVIFLTGGSPNTITGTMTLRNDNTGIGTTTTNQPQNSYFVGDKVGAFGQISTLTLQNNSAAATGFSELLLTANSIGGEGAIDDDATSVFLFNNGVFNVASGVNEVIGSGNLNVDGSDIPDGVYSSTESWITGAGFITVGAITAIPEPSSTALLGLGGLALILRRRK